jgi:hypothetical protein
MDKHRSTAAPVILAVVLILLPLLYGGSYLALVKPRFWAAGALPHAARSERELPLRRRAGRLVFLALGAD